MPQVTLYAPAIHCEHCIETIRRTVDAQTGARFLAGDIEGRRFNIEVDRWDRLEAIGTALAEEEYPLGDATDVEASAAHDIAAGPTHPAYRVTRTDAGADVNYDCPCSCVAGFAFDRSQADQSPESCCCGRLILVGAQAADRLGANLDEPAAYFETDVQTVTMPWGQPLEVALATPRAAEHGAMAGSDLVRPQPLALDFPMSGSNHAGH